MSGPGWHGGARWNLSMTRAQRRATSAALRRATDKRSGDAMMPGWSVFMVPSTGPPFLIELRRRDEFGKVVQRVPVWNDTTAWAERRSRRMSDTMRKTLRRGVKRGTITVVE